MSDSDYSYRANFEQQELNTYTYNVTEDQVAYSYCKNVDEVTYINHNRIRSNSMSFLMFNDCDNNYRKVVNIN